MDLGEGMELWLGLFQSAVLGRTSLYLNVDVAHKAFPSAMSLLDYLKSFDRNGVLPTRLTDWQSQQLNEFLKMLSVEYRLPGAAPKTFGFNGLKAGAKAATFVDAAGVKMSVFEYFKRDKNITLRYPGKSSQFNHPVFSFKSFPVQICHACTWVRKRETSTYP